MRGYVSFVWWSLESLRMQQYWTWLDNNDEVGSRMNNILVPSNSKIYIKRTWIWWSLVIGNIFLAVTWHLNILTFYYNIPFRGKATFVQRNQDKLYYYACICYFYFLISLGSNYTKIEVLLWVIFLVHAIVCFSSQPSYVLHIFPPCDFAREHLARVSPDLLDSAADSGHLMVVVASV